jgi:RND family efflux transporter MFP subunit
MSRHARRLSAALCALALGACSRGAAPESASTQPVSVAVQVARLDVLTDALTASGQVVTASAADWTIRAPEPAEIVDLPKAEGDAVRAGDLLVRFEIAEVTQEVSAKQIELSMAESRVQSAKADVDRNTPLSDRGLIPRNMMEASRGALADAQAALTVAKVAFETTRLLQERTIVRARFPGVVVKSWHHRGDYVTPSDPDPVLRVIDPSRLQVAVSLSMLELGRVAPGQDATVMMPGMPGERATVVLRPMVTDPEARTAEVRLALAAPTSLTIDTAVEVEIVLDRRENVIVVPRASILHDDDSSYVMVAGPDDRAHRHDVRLGLLTTDRAEILSGLAVGDRVITGDLSQISEGLLISVER